MTTAFANPFRPMNPFLTHDEVTAVDVFATEDVADARDVSYALVKSGPAVDPAEVESHLDAVEVKVTWGTQVLYVDHLSASARRSFRIGADSEFEVPGFDFPTPVVEMRGDAAFAMIPAEATATVSARGEHPRAVKGGDEIALTEGMGVRIELPSDLVIEIATVRAGKKYPVSLMTALASGAAAFIGLSFVGHAAVVASLAMFMPAMGADDAEAINRDQILMMQKMLNASAERNLDEPEPQQAGAEEAGGGSKAGQPHEGESGAAGKQTATATSGHMAFKGSDDHVRLSRKDELAMARDWGMVGMLNAGLPQTGPSSPWATESQLGQDKDNKWGALYGADANDVMGYGLGLSGTGEGGGGHGLGVGIDGIGNLVGGGGNGPAKWGIGKGDKDGIGDGHSPLRGGHVAKAPQVRTPTSFETNGRLPAEVIQRIVRQNFGRFRMCYEAGLRNNPSLNGRVVTKFVIGRDGAVAQAQDGGSDLPNQEVIGCVVRSFTALSFPSPEGGIATVSYPIALSPGQ